ncbi:MAG: type II toxin-antitoxin system Phd/YefM family antitoxin [Clostridia bacterium]|nr:type II toxin-antitoxin system Phd/YefM family antitoxin [Clostridia bacterium]
MEVTVTELKRHLGKYLDMAQRERVYITRKGKTVAVLSSLREERMETIKSLFGCIPADITLEEARKERLSGM